MIPIKLEIEGLYSYQERAVIDFSRLSEGRLFGIFGAVGSGKSALLEAITFALYGETERMGATGRNYNMMNLRSDRLFIGFEFSAGQEHQEYKFEVRSTRNSKNFDKVGTYDRVGYQWSGKEWIPLESNDATRILHLSYNNFIKTIIIPQGKFQEFLHLTATPRTQMLQEIFELHRFDLSGPTKRLTEENDHALSRLQGSLQEVPEIAEEELKQLEQKQGEQQEALTKLELRLEALEKQGAELKQIKEIKDNLAEVRDTLDILEPSEPEFKEKEARLKQYTKVLSAFGEPLQRHKSFVERQQSLEKEQLALESQKAPLKEEISQLEKRYGLALEAYEQRESLRSKAGELKTLLEMIEIAQAQKELEERLVKGNGLVEAQQQKRETLKEALKTLEGKVNALREEMPDGELLQALRSWFEQFKYKQEALAESLREQEVTEAKAKRENKELLDWITQPLVQSVAVDGERSLDGLEKALETEIQALEDELDSFQKRSQELQLQSGLASYAEALVSGEACPLCGATDHPAPFHSEGASSQLEKLDKQAEATRRRLRELRNLKPQLHGWKLQEKQNEDQLAKAKATTESRSQVVQEHIKAFNWEGFQPDQPQALEALTAKEKSLREELGKGEKELQTLREQVEQNQQEIDRFQKALTEMVVTSSTQKAKLETLSASLQHFAYDAFQEQSREEIQKQSDEFTALYQQVTQEYEAAKASLETKKDAYRTLEKNLEFGARGLKQVASELEQLNQDLRKKVEAHQLRDLEEVERILAWELDPVAEEEEIRVFRKDLDRARTEWVTYKKQEAGRTYDPEVYAKLMEELEQGKVQRSQLEQELAGLQFKVKDYREKIAKRKALLEELEKLQLRADNLKVLELLFRGSGFVNYVSTIYLRELCLRANIRFQQLTRHQLSLEIDEKNDFQVRDNLNGGRLRSVKTLSGGQTFQASLCLALALADNITHRVGSSQNFFFLDEGFGTLDRDSLALVFETLKQLRKENRIVGVISHVEEMQQEIDHSLLIRKDEERGSLVKGSWE